MTSARERTRPSNPHCMNNDSVPAALPVQETVTFCVNCGRTGSTASGCTVPGSATTEEQVKASPQTN